MGVYVGSLNVGQLDRLNASGIDRDESRLIARKRDTTAVEAVLSAGQATRLVAQGLPLKLKAKSSRQVTTQKVFRQYNAPGGLRDEMAATVAGHSGLAKLVTIGTSLRGVPIQAVKVTRDAQQVPDGKRPAVLYLGAQHAREWITPEMVRRLMHYVLDGYGTDPVLTKLLNTTELWFLPVANPDGYDFTFTPGNRLWRKNLRDNNGDGKITDVDGVDLNRNFAEKWGYDNEGSSNNPSDETYRGSAPNSEPETQALDHLLRRIGFAFLVNYHSPAELLLYGAGWQVGTPSPDDQIAVAMAGDPARPAVPGSNPELTAALYTSNGDTDYHAQIRYGTIAFAAEMSSCSTASNVDPTDRWDPADCESDFAFPDDETLIAGEFRKNLPFALSVAASAHDPADPVSAIGRSTPDLVASAFDTSYGAQQQVAVTARRSLGDVTLHYRINGNREHVAGVIEWRGGKRYGGNGNRYFTELRGTVRGTRPKDEVAVWFTARKGGSTVASTTFAYRVADHIGGDVLVLAAEDVTGDSPVSIDGATSARYVDDHVAALRQAGYAADVYDMDTHNRRAPDSLGVLSHYKTVVWETGDDIVPRTAGMEEGIVDRSAVQTDDAVRDYLNEGGKVLLDGKYAGYAEATDGLYSYPLDGSAKCPCAPLGNDFQQYWLGVYSYADDYGTGPDGPFPVAGFGGFTGTLNAAGSAGNQDHTALFQTTSSSLPQQKFASAAALEWVPPSGSPFVPSRGDWYVWSGEPSDTYKRLTRTVDLSAAASGRLRFATAFTAAQDQDYLFVEAHEVGSDNWTTLPDASGHTSTATGQSCREGLTTIQPFLSHYIDDNCGPTGSTGSWNAASGSSAGWQDWDIDLSRYAGRKVEVSISYAATSLFPGPGVFLDDVEVVVNGTDTAHTSFESDLGGWAVSDPPAGSPAAAGNYRRSRQAFGAGVTTPDSVYLSFGLEGLPPNSRNDLVRRAMTYLDGPSRH